MKRNVTVLLVGILLLGVNLLVLGPMATGGVQGAVDEKFATYPKDKVCANDDCSEVNEDWATSVSTRDYYAWTLTNPDDVLYGDDPVFVKIGPVTYEITAERTLLDHDADAGTLTYQESKSYVWTGGVPGTTPITGLNILYEPQRIAATALIIDFAMTFTKAGFTSGMMGNDMNNTGASIITAALVAEDIESLGLTDNSTGWHAKHAELDSSVADDMLNSRLTSAGQDISLTSKWGPMMFISRGKPDCDVDLQGPDGGTAVIGPNTTERAALYGYLDISSNLSTLQTCMQDGSIFLDLLEKWYANGGYAPADIELVPPEHATNGTMVFPGVYTDGIEWNDPSKEDSWSDRVKAISGADIDASDVSELLYGGDDTGSPTGLLATNPGGSSFGVYTFLGMSKDAAMESYDLDAAQYDAIWAWADGWMSGSTEFPMALRDGTGSLNSSTFVATAFGNEDPLNGGFLTASLNVGGLWATMFKGIGATENVALTVEQSHNILYGPLGITGAAATMFLYGETTGETPPFDMETLTLTADGEVLPWDTALVARLYGIDNNSALSLRFFVNALMFGEQVPKSLISLFGEEATGYPGATKWVTHTVDQWLFGWRDPLIAQLEGDVDDVSLGWQSLETNKTYFGSDGVLNGNGTIYKICTGENDACDKGEMIEQDGSTQLFWRDDEMEVASFGRLTPISLVGTTGGFITGDGDKVNMGDYAVADLVKTGEGDYHGVPTHTYRATADPPSHNIQAKLINTRTLLDIFPGAVPVYFGGEVNLEVEPTSNLIIKGVSTSRFYLDTRPMDVQARIPATLDNLTPIFEIQTSGEAGEENAADMKSGITHNQQLFTYWTNFDVWVDYVTLFIYIIADVAVLAGIVLLVRGGDHAHPDLELEPDITFGAAGEIADAGGGASEDAGIGTQAGTQMDMDSRD